MQTRKYSINAQLFAVTVLSAWLGLMIVSVPVHVYAQTAAVSKNQSTSGAETKAKETANESSELNLRDRAFSDPVLTFIEDVRKLASLDKYKLDDRELAEISMLTRKGSDTVSTSATSVNIWVRDAASVAAERLWKNLPKEYRFYRFDEKLNADVERCTVEFLLEDNGLVVTTKYNLASDEHANKLATAFNSFFAKNICECNDESENIIYQNTKALTEKNQVLVVTRLPRGSLDTLLDAK